MAKPLITALIDTYNHERYIEQALLSVFEQGLSPAELEIVVVDDGSTDRTPEIIRRFTPRVKHLRKKNGGQASAFNAGFAEARGKFVALLDGDDWWEKGKLPAVLAAFEKTPEVFGVSHAYYQYWEETNRRKVYGPSEPARVGLTTVDAARDALQKWAFLQTSALTVRRELVERITPIPKVLRFSADSPIATASMALGALVLPQPLSCYRVHGDNLYATSSSNPAKLRRKLEMDDIMFGVLSPRLRALGVPPECVSTLFDEVWVHANRRCLRTFGGSPLKTLRTEMRSFRLAHRKPSTAYITYKYLCMAPAALLLPPRVFYRVRDWYAAHHLQDWRDRLFKSEETPRADR